MPDKTIAIITGANAMLGSGHLHRMTALLWFLKEHTSFPAYMVLDEIPSFFPDEFLPLVKQDIQSPTDFIIRDKRDSTIEEIKKLQKTGPVLALDDIGPGRKIADHCIDLLPNPEPGNIDIPIKSRELFIYGYGFIRSLIELKKDNSPVLNVFGYDFMELGNSSARCERAIDFALYPGYDSSEEYIKTLVSLLPKGSSYAVLQGDNTTLSINSRKIDPGANSYSAVLMSSKVFISHFGISVYEAYLSDCRPITINPTEYHSRLSDIVGPDLKLVNLGEYSKLNTESARQIISEIHSQSQTAATPPKIIYEKAIGNLIRFSDFLESIIF